MHQKNINLQIAEKEGLCTLSPYNKKLLLLILNLHTCRIHIMHVLTLQVSYFLGAKL